jgi:hypothetical protein
MTPGGSIQVSRSMGATRSLITASASESAVSSSSGPCAAAFGSATPGGPSARRWAFFAWAPGPSEACLDISTNHASHDL